MGTTRKLRICTAGHSTKLAFRVGRYTSRNFCVSALRPPPSAMVMYEKKQARPAHGRSVRVRNPSARHHIPNGAKISWSKATRFSAGLVGFFLVSGNALDRKPNHWNCSGAIKKPYAINRVRRSKSKGGGDTLANPNSPTAGGFCLFRSLNSMEMKSSSCDR